jgi:hypothetical protein
LLKGCFGLFVSTNSKANLLYSATDIPQNFCSAPNLARTHALIDLRFGHRVLEMLV